MAGQYNLTVVVTNGRISDSRMLPLLIKERYIPQQQQEGVISTMEKTVVYKRQEYNDSQVNNDESMSILVQSDQKYSDQLTNRYDSRHYSLSLEKTSVVNFAFTAMGASSYSLSVQESKNISQSPFEEVGQVNIVTELYNDSEKITENFNLYLRPGDYLIKITGGKVWRDEKNGNSFILTVKASQNESCEAENNNTIELANQVNNAATYASSYKGDIDYFTFNLDQRTVVLPKIDFIPI